MLMPVGGQHICIEVPRDEELRTPRSLADLRDDVFQCGGAVHCYVPKNHVPAAPSCCHLESGDVQAVMSVCVHRQALRLFLEERHAPAVAAWRV